jgi:hypothetical protein
MQTFEDKCEALRSVLPLLYAHLQLLPQMRITQRFEYGDMIPANPKPVWAGDCWARCPICNLSRDCRGEPWEGEGRRLARTYRLNTIMGQLVRLDRMAPQLSHAVFAVYVEPNGLPNSDGWQTRWAEAGVRWLARKIREELVCLWDEPKSTKDRVADLIADGVTSPRVIAQRVGVSYRHAKRLKSALCFR